MKYRVKVHGPSVTSQSGADIFDIAGDPVDVTETSTGTLRIRLAGGNVAREGRVIRAVEVCYPRGGWTKVTILEEEEV